MNRPKVLITGGSGMVGRYLTPLLLAGYDFLADTCRKWEEAACRFSNSGIHTLGSEPQLR
jgi:NAD dependent epimerase/dehydratase family enzyme